MMVNGNPRITMIQKAQKQQSKLAQVVTRLQKVFLKKEERKRTDVFNRVKEVLFIPLASLGLNVCYKIKEKNKTKRSFLWQTLRWPP